MFDFKHAAAAGLAVLVGTLFTACDPGEDVRPDTVPAEPVLSSPTAFERDLLALKAREKDPLVLERAIRDLVLRHGYPLPVDEAAGTLPASPSPAAKVAAGAEVFTVKDFSASGITSFQVTPGGIEDGDSISVMAQGKDATDPYIVAYYLDGQYGSSSAYHVKVVGLSDDSPSSKNPSFKWRNQTGSKKTLRVLIFAHSTSTRGSADLTVRRGGSTSTFTDIPVGGKVSYSNSGIASPSSGCTGPESRIWAKTYNTGTQRVQVLAVNSSKMKGSWIWPGPTGLDILGTPIPSGHPNFVVAFKDGDFSPPETQTWTFRVIQEDQYLCD